jgi:teichuronic acid biosynthesis glycosyltransferase TuaC
MTPFPWNVLYLAPPPRSPDRLAEFTFLHEEVEALARHGVKVHLVIPEGIPSNPPPNVKVHPLPAGRARGERSRTAPFLLRRIPALGGAMFRIPPVLLYHLARVERFVADVARAEGVDVIHSHFGWPGGFGGALASLHTGVPLVASFRGMDLLMDPEIDYGLRLNPAYDAALRVLLSEAWICAFASDFMRGEGERLGADPARGAVVRKGVDTERFSPVAEKRILARSLGFSEPLVLSVGGLIRRKGVDHTLAALARLRDTHRFELAICGEGEEEGALRRLAEALGIADRVRFLGTVPRDRIADFFAAADVFVHAALAEASGNVILEAMASGVPIVCTDAGGPPEYVVDGRTAFVTPLADPAALADKVGLLLDSPELRADFGGEGRRRADANFRYELMVERIVSVYEAAAERRAPQPEREARKERLPATVPASILPPTEPGRSRPG